MTIERTQKIQNLYTHTHTHIHTHTYTHTHKKQRNIRERCVTIKRIVQMLKLLKDQKTLKNQIIHNLEIIETK